jgi:hypothetical protein
VDALGLDEDALDSFQASAPGEVGAVAAALGRGQTPRQLLVGSVHAPQAVEAALLEMARRGVILGVRDSHGVDLVATSLTEREEALAHSHAMAEEDEALELAEDSALDYAAPVPLVPPAAKAPAVPAVASAPAPAATVALPAAHDELPLVIADEPDAYEGDAYEGDDESEVAPSDEVGLLTKLALLFMLVAVGYVGYMMVVESNHPSESPVPYDDPAAPPAEPAMNVEGAAEGAGEPDVLEDGASAPDAAEAEDDGAPQEDGLSFGTLTPGVRLEGGRVPDGHGVLHVLESGADDVVVSVGDQVLGAPPQQVALPEGRHAVNFRVGDTTVQRFYFVRGGHTRVVPVPER